MNIAHVVPGSGGSFYCQNCVRDLGLVRALSRAGHDVLFVPLYLPLMEMPAAERVKRAPVFYGAINAYLAQNVPLVRKLPEAIRRRLDAPGLLRWAARRAGTTDAGGLGALTLSVLEGRDGRQRRELEQLTAWLMTQPRPDIVHFSDALLLGLAPAVREATGAPIACTLQDEDTWLDALPSPYRERCWARIRALCRGVDLFFPVSETYAAHMRERLDLPEDRCRVLPAGIDVEAFSPPPSVPETPVIGFLSELSEVYGLDILVEAFLALKRRPGLADLRLRVTGGNADARTRFLKRLRRRIAGSGHAGAIDFLPDFRQDARISFLRSLTVLSVPAVRPEAFGLFLVEAMACGVPVVAPDAGGYPDVVRAAGGGVIYSDRSVVGLVEALAPFLIDHALAARTGAAGRAGVEQHFNIARVARDMTEAYTAASASASVATGSRVNRLPAQERRMPMC